MSHLKLVINNSKPKRIDTEGSKEKITALMNLLNPNPQIALQIPAQFDKKRFIEWTPERLGMEIVTPFNHPNTGTNYLRLSKNLDEQEQWKDRLRTILETAGKIRRSITAFYGQKSADLKTPKTPWTLEIPFGIKEEFIGEKECLTETIKMHRELHPKEKLPHLQITRGELTYFTTAPSPKILIENLREQLRKPLPFTLEALEDILI